MKTKDYFFTHLSFYHLLSFLNKRWVLVLIFFVFNGMMYSQEKGVTTIDIGWVTKTENRINYLESELKKNIKTPVGIIVAYYGKEAPEGWLACDGSTIPTIFKELRKLIGSKTPNLQGRFLRGIKKNTKIGTFQDDQIASHRHFIFNTNNSRNGNIINSNSTATRMESFDKSQDYEIKGSKDDASVGKTSSFGGAKETRPKNVSILWIIKY